MKLNQKQQQMALERELTITPAKFKIAEKGTTHRLEIVTWTILW